MILHACGNLAFRWDFLANRWKSMCPRSENPVVLGQIWALFVLLGVPWCCCLSCLALLTFAGVACHAWRCSALLGLLLGVI